MTARVPSLVAFLLAFATGISGCGSMLYQGTSYQHADPEKGGLHYEDLWIPAAAANAPKIHAWYFKSSEKKSPKALIIFFHGNGENLSSHFATLAWILAYGYDYLIFDYRGYWKSEGKATPENTVEDAISVMRYSHERFKNVPLVVFAQSLGGAVALRSLIELKHEIPIKLVTIDSSFKSYKAAGRSALSHSWLTWIMQPLTYVALSDEWAPGDRVSEISPTPIVVMHGDQDQLMNYDLGERLFEACKEPKEFWKIEGGHHIDSFWRHKGIFREKYLKRLDQALATDAPK